MLEDRKAVLIVTRACSSSESSVVGADLCVRLVDVGLVSK